MQKNLSVAHSCKKDFKRAPAFKIIRSWEYSKDQKRIKACGWRNIQWNLYSIRDYGDRFSSDYPIPTDAQGSTCSIFHLSITTFTQIPSCG